MNENIIKKLLPHFSNWYETNPHKQNEDYYKDTINYNYLSSLNKAEFIDFFYNFFAEGGKIQSGGDRYKNRFKTSIENNFNDFRSVILNAFNENLDLQEWFESTDKFKGFGQGIATIFLNRINKNKYSVVNQKTENFFKGLGIKIPTDFFQKYSIVNQTQKQWIETHSEIKNYYIADAIAHFAIGEGGFDLIMENNIIEIWKRYRDKVLPSLNDSQDWSDSLEKMYTTYGGLTAADIDNLTNDELNELWFSNTHISHISYFLEKKNTSFEFYREVIKTMIDKGKTIGEAFDACLSAFYDNNKYKGKNIGGQIAQIIRTLFTIRNVNFSVVDLTRMNYLLTLFHKDQIDSSDFKNTFTKGVNSLTEITNEISTYDNIVDYNKRKILWRLWRVATGNEKENEPKINNNVDMNNLNTILYGPPGTGKTYSTIESAIKITNPEYSFPDTGNIKTDREAIKEEFRRLLSKGQIVFTTFHQNLCYEDFIEGLKPIEPLKEGDPVIYRVESGLFRQLCVDASFYIAKLRESSETEEVLDFSMAYEQYVEKLEELLSKNETVKLDTKTGGKVLVDSISQLGNIIIKHIDGTRTYTVSKDRLKKLQKAITDLDDVNNINDQFRAIIGGSNTTTYWAVLNAIRNEKPQTRSRIEKKVYTWDEKKEVVASLKNEDYRTEDAQQYVFIIDEINRGNVSQIFGELITLIEDDKRAGKPEALEVILPYSKEKFTVPPNIHIIGTMNTADRSVEALDTALRRRFSFEFVPPDPKLVPEKLEGYDLELRTVFEKINERITYLLDEDHQIGHSYFMNIKTDVQLKETFKNKIIPLLKEYFYKDYGKIRLILGDDFVEKIEEPKFAIKDPDVIEREQYKLKPFVDIDIIEALKKSINNV
jgi:hypothetical protein